MASTGLLVAAIRANESTREDRLFTDPYADRLAGETGRAILAAAIAEAGEQSTVQIVVRTRFLDDALLRAAEAAQQVVILAAGMDARAYRSPVAGRHHSLRTRREGGRPRRLDQHGACGSRSGLTSPTTAARGTPDGRAGFDLPPREPAVWLIEGLLQYLDEGAVHTVFDRVNALSAPNSTLLYDIVGKSLLESPAMAPLLNKMAAQGSPWRFGTDEPGSLLERHGWSTTVTDIAEQGNRLNRWFEPAVPMDVPDVPRGYFVEPANKPRDFHTPYSLTSPRWRC